MVGRVQAGVRAAVFAGPRAPGLRTTRRGVNCARKRPLALRDDRGELLWLSDRRHTLAEDSSSFIVLDGRWRDFAYPDTRYRVLSAGGLQFTGRRVAQGVALVYGVEVEAAAAAITVTYDRRALTGGQAHMCRQQGGLSGGGVGRRKVHRATGRDAAPDAVRGAGFGLGTAPVHIHRALECNDRRGHFAAGQPG